MSQSTSWTPLICVAITLVFADSSWADSIPKEAIAAWAESDSQTSKSNAILTWTSSVNGELQYKFLVRHCGPYLQVIFYRAPTDHDVFTYGPEGDFVMQGNFETKELQLTGLGDEDSTGIVRGRKFVGLEIIHRETYFGSPVMELFNQCSDINIQHDFDSSNSALVKISFSDPNSVGNEGTLFLSSKDHGYMVFDKSANWRLVGGEITRSGSLEVDPGEVISDFYQQLKESITYFDGGSETIQQFFDVSGNSGGAMVNTISLNTELPPPELEEFTFSYYGFPTPKSVAKTSVFAYWPIVLILLVVTCAIYLLRKW